MSTRSLCACALAVGSVVVLMAQPAGAAPPRPNILFIFADDHSPKTVSCYERAYPLAKTPNIDALAASGVRFRSAYLGSWCMPSRASLLTGLHPHRIESMRMEGEYPGSAYDPAQCRFWPAEFRKQGYQTAQIGKWHTGTDTGFGRDWDRQIVWNRPKNPSNAKSYYGPQITEINGQEQTVQGYATDNYTKWACDYIRGQDRDPNKPWYLWVCYGAIHGPTIPAPRHKGTLAGQEMKPPADIVGPRPGKPRYLDTTQAWRRSNNGSAELLKGKNKSYSAWLQQANECMRSVDDGVGDILAALKASGQLENTLVVYSSDQGFANGEHGLQQKVAPYEASYSSPLIVSRPGTLPQGVVCRQAVNAPDLVVTFFAQAGLQLPWPMHGRDITPLLKEPTKADGSLPTLYTHFGQDYGSNVAKKLKKGSAVHSGVPYYVAVRQGPYKFVRYLGAQEPDELYDLDTDPEELVNRADDAQLAEVRKRLLAALASECRRHDVDFANVNAGP